MKFPKNPPPTLDKYKIVTSNGARRYSKERVYHEAKITSVDGIILKVLYQFDFFAVAFQIKFAKNQTYLVSTTTC